MKKYIILLLTLFCFSDAYAVILIIQSPYSNNSCLGKECYFSVTANGTGLTYQWQKLGTNNTWNDIAGANSRELKIANVTETDAGSYRVVIKDDAYNEMTLPPVQLSIRYPISITQQPVANAVCPGETCQFTVTAVGTNATYQWQKLDNGNTWNNISGANTNKLVFNNATMTDAGSYRVVVNGSCSTETSQDVTLTLNTPVAITQQPVSGIVCAGETHQFTVIAVGTNAFYQWQKHDNGNTWNNISGANTNKLVFNNATMTDAGSYRVVVYDNCGTTKTSAQVTLILTTQVAITQQPVGNTICPGETHQFTVTAVGTNTTFQWQQLDVGNTWNNISGANTDKLEFTNATVADEGSYRVVVNGTCGTKTSAEVTLTVNTPATITQQPVDNTVCPGETHRFTVTTVGTNATYQWQQLDAGNTWNNILGANTDKLELTNVTVADAGSYRVVVGGSCGTTQTSAEVTLTVNTPVAIIQQPVSGVISPGETHTFSSVVSGSVLNYKWYKKGNSNPVFIGVNYQTSEAGVYYIRVTGLCGDTVTSKEVALTVQYPTPTINRTVSLHTYEGLTTNLPPGVSSISSGRNFSFKYYLKEGYTAENIKITTGYEQYDDQITIIPEKDGGFLVTIYAIQHAIEINITGVEVFGSVDNEKLEGEDSPSVWSYGQMLYIRTQEDTEITIYDTKGVLYKKERIPAGLQSYSLSKGIYIVRFNNDPVRKVVIY